VRAPRTLLAAAGAALFLWCGEAGLVALVAEGEPSFLGALGPGLPPEQLLARVLSVGVVLTLGAFLHVRARRRARAARLETLRGAVQRGMAEARALILRERDTGRLLEGVCARLVEAGGFRAAWAVSLDADGPPREAAQARDCVATVCRRAPRRSWTKGGFTPWGPTGRPPAKPRAPRR